MLPHLRDFYLDKLLIRRFKRFLSKKVFKINGFFDLIMISDNQLTFVQKLIII